MATECKTRKYKVHILGGGAFPMLKYLINGTRDDQVLFTTSPRPLLASLKWTSVSI